MLFGRMRACDGSAPPLTTIAANNAITALGNGGRPRRALALLGSYPALGLETSTVSYNTAMHACGVDKAQAAAHLPLALALLVRMRAPDRPAVVPPANSNSYHTAVGVCFAANAHNTALGLFDAMLNEVRGKQSEERHHSLRCAFCRRTVPPMPFPWRGRILVLRRSFS